jgi:hypothetical protein
MPLYCLDASRLEQNHECVQLHSHGGANFAVVTKAIGTSEFLVASSLATTTTFATTAGSTAAATIAAATAAGRSRFPRASLIHGQWPAFNSLAIEFRDGVLSVLVGTHRDKRKATRFAGEFVLHEGDFLHVPSCAKSSCSSFSVVLKERLPTYSLVPIEFILERSWVTVPAYRISNRH